MFQQLLNPKIKFYRYNLNRIDIYKIFNKNRTLQKKYINILKKKKTDV